MIEIGKKNKLIIKRFTSVGVYLNEIGEADDTDILLPKAQIPENAEVLDEIEVFVYRDSQDRLISTTNEPLIYLGEFAYLKVVDVSKIGAFMSWGLEKDLFLPFKEQRNKVKIGEQYYVGLYLDKSDRLCATMNVYDMLTVDHEYKAGDTVKGVVYGINKDRGAFVAIDNKYHGFLGRGDLERVMIGDEKLFMVQKVRDDLKINLSFKNDNYLHIDDDATQILEDLEDNNGFLPFNDKSSPKVILSEFDMSKASFKRALGRLLKMKKITITPEGINLKKK